MRLSTWTAFKQGMYVLVCVRVRVRVTVRACVFSWFCFRLGSDSLLIISCPSLGSNVCVERFSR